MASRLRIAAGLLLLFVVAAAANRDLQAAKKKPKKPASLKPVVPKAYGQSLYDCVVKAKLLDLQAAIDAANLKDMLSDPKLKMTLVAPDAGGFQAFFGDCQNPAKVKPVNVSPFCSRDELLAGGAKLVQLVKYHLLPGSIEAKKGNTYFKNGNKFLKSKTFEGTIVRTRYWTNGFEIHGTGRDGFIRGKGKETYVCGAGRMHVVDNVITIDPATL